MRKGTVKRLNNTSVRFTVTGEATLLGIAILHAILYRPIGEVPLS